MPYILPDLCMLRRIADLRDNRYLCNANEAARLSARRASAHASEYREIEQAAWTAGDVRTEGSCADGAAEAGAACFILGPSMTWRTSTSWAQLYNEVGDWDHGRPVDGTGKAGLRVGGRGRSRVVGGRLGGEEGWKDGVEEGGGVGGSEGPKDGEGVGNELGKKVGPA